MAAETTFTFKWASAVHVHRDLLSARALCGLRQTRCSISSPLTREEPSITCKRCRRIAEKLGMVLDYDGPADPEIAPQDRRYRPFPNGTSYMDWIERNCGTCERYVPDSQVDSGDGCVIEESLAFACIDDGTISADIAERMGYAGEVHAPRCKSWAPNAEASEMMQRAAARAATLPLFPEIDGVAS